MHFNHCLQLTLSIWPFKDHISAVARELFSLHACCKITFSLVDEDVP